MNRALRHFPTFRRIVAAVKRAFYAAAETNRLTSAMRTQKRVHPDTPVLSDGATIRARIRELRRNNPIMASCFRAFLAGVLSSQVLAEPNLTRRREDSPSEKTNAAWNTPVARIWDDWCAGPCDFGGWASHATSFGAMQRMAAESCFADGELFVVRRYRESGPGLPGIQIELVETDRLADTFARPAGGWRDGQRNGVEYDAAGRPTAYWFRRSSGFDQQAERVDARDVIHMMVPGRPGGQAGTLPLGPTLLQFFHLGSAVDSELAARALLSKVAGVLRSGDDSWMEEKTDGNGLPFRQAELEDATILQLPDGDFTELSLNRPGAAFPEIVKVFLRWIAAGAGIPFSMLAANFEGLNYTVSRAEQQAWLPTCRIWQEDIIRDQFVRAVYERWFVPQIVLEELVSIPFGLTLRDAKRALYRLPKRAYVDPGKDAAADLVRIQGGLASPQEVLGEQGRNFFEVIDQIAEAKRYAAERGCGSLAMFATPSGMVASAEDVPGIDPDAAESSAAQPNTAPEDGAKLISMAGAR